MVQIDAWLSQYFYPKQVYQYLTPFDEKKLPEGFIYGRVDKHDIHSLSSLINQGFDIIETSLIFNQKNSLPYFQAKDSLLIRMASDKDKAAVQEIAQHAFTHSRLYQDPHISAELASTIKKDWVTNYFLGNRGTSMIVCETQDAAIVGFILLMNNIIDLIAVAPAYCRHGIALKMIGLANQKFGLLTAGTQSINKASIRLCQKSGFHLKDVQFVLHKH